MVLNSGSYRLFGTWRIVLTSLYFHYTFFFFFCHLQYSLRRTFYDRSHVLLLTHVPDFSYFQSDVFHGSKYLYSQVFPLDFQVSTTLVTLFVRMYRTPLIGLTRENFRPPIHYSRLTSKENSRPKSSNNTFCLTTRVVPVRSRQLKNGRRHPLPSRVCLPVLCKLSITQMSIVGFQKKFPKGSWGFYLQ